MAVVNILSIQVTDDRGDTTSTTLPIPSALSVGDIQAYVTTMLPLFDAVTGGKITGCSVSLGLTLPGGLKASAIADHLNGMGVNLGWSAANTNYKHSLRVPAVDQGLVTAGEFDTGAAAWTNFLPYIVTGDGTVAPCDRYGNDITAFLSAEVTFRKS